MNSKFETIKKEFENMLQKKDISECTWIAMVEERIFIIEYKNIFFMIADPLDGFYGLFEEAATYDEYVALGHANTDDYYEIYEAKKLETYLKSIE